MEIGGEYFQETHPAELFRECSVYCELVSVPAQLPRLLQIAMRSALQRGGVAVVVVPGEVFLDEAGAARVTPVRPAAAVIRPADSSLVAAADVLNAADRVTILAGAGCAGAHDQLLALAGALQAPVVHAFRGKEFIEYDNPYDVGMTGLIGFSSGYRAMEHCDALLMLGTDFPYRPFFPEDAPVVQVDVRGERIGRRVPVEVPLVGTVGAAAEGLLPLLRARTDSAHLDRMTAHYRRARARLDKLARDRRNDSPLLLPPRPRDHHQARGGRDKDGPRAVGEEGGPAGGRAHRSPARYLVAPGGTAPVRAVRAGLVGPDDPAGVPPDQGRPSAA